MKATISTTIPANAEHMWEELQKVNSLCQVASPILVFKPQKGGPLPPTWAVGHTYALNLSAFHVVPLGTHYIDVKQIDPSNREIFTNEHGALTKTWNHFIRIQPLSESKLQYTDEIEIDAGILTPLIWAFAHIFYRHRQRRWKRLLAN